MLYAIVRDHLSSFLAMARESYARPLPKYVQHAFEQYLRCGLPEHGVLRVRCDHCGLDRIVAFSCKVRGTCPSCAGRVMANTGAHLVDRVLPNLPLRQWVLSLPFDLRRLAAKSPEAVCAIDRILFREVERWMRRRAGPSCGRAGALTFVQRFGGSLNLHVHFHVLFVEGLFTRDPGALPRFHASFAPTSFDLLAVLTRVRDSVRRWLARTGYNDTASSDDDAWDACARVATERGLFDVVQQTTSVADERELASGNRRSQTLDGFNLHAAVAVGPDDDVSRERLVRYCARPPFALERLSILPDGRIAYAIKQSRKGATHRILEPVELLARIAALIPPPRRPFLRYHGVLAPHSKWRDQIVPRFDPGHAAAVDTRASGHAANPNRPPDPSRDSSPSQASNAPSSGRAAFALIAPAHRARLDGGSLFATSPRLDWPRLLRRTFAVEVLVCPRCRGPARVLAVIEDEHEARRLVTALGEGSRPIPPSAPRHEDQSLPNPPHADDDDFERPPDSAETELANAGDLTADD